MSKPKVNTDQLVEAFAGFNRAMSKAADGLRGSSALTALKRHDIPGAVVPLAEMDEAGRDEFARACRAAAALADEVSRRGPVDEPESIAYDRRGRLVVVEPAPADEFETVEEWEAGQRRRGVTFDGRADRPNPDAYGVG